MNLLFTAKSTVFPGRTLLVKLVDPKRCNTGVHSTLAEEGFAPLLYGTAHVAGAPSAIVMEYLSEYSGWTTLHNCLRKHPNIMVDTTHPQLAKLLKLMKEKKIVHGDLRPNNIMCRVRQELEIKVIDFDWSGDLGVAKYPEVMNPTIPWPGRSRELIGESHDEALLTNTLERLRINSC